MNLVKFGACWINPKHISCAKIEEVYNEFKEKYVYAVVVVCYGHELARMYYDHREDAELILNEVLVKAMAWSVQESDNNGECHDHKNQTE